MINYYQQWVKNSPKLLDENDTDLVLFYLVGLMGELGELSEKIKKIKRDKLSFNEEKRVEIKKEIGDIFWYLTSLSNELNINLEEVLKLNIMKLENRISKNKISGSGDNR